MDKHQAQGFSLVELLAVMTVAAVILLAAFKFFNKDYVKAKISGTIGYFEPIKLALTEFRVLHGDLRKLNSSRPQEMWSKLLLKDPSTETKNLAAVRVWSLSANSVQVLLCLNQDEIKIPQGSKLGILYDGSYNGDQLAWQCSFVVNRAPDEHTAIDYSIRSLSLLLPESCRKLSVSSVLECN